LKNKLTSTIQELKDFRLRFKSELGENKPFKKTLSPEAKLERIRNLVADGKFGLLESLVKRGEI
jgi:hypothetical protein